VPRPPSITIASPDHPLDYEAVRALFIEYGKSLGFSLGYQGFDTELAELPGDMRRRREALLLARVDGVGAGMVGVRQLAPEIGEMKRLYVRPTYRALRTDEGLSIGRALAFAIVAEARALGYRRLRLDTISSEMAAAIRLYKSMGFTEIPPYYPSDIPDTVYMELILDAETGQSA
jgi:ribosomal protein S18 acetylase RimI-like enzyme